MASYTNSLRLVLPATGEYPGTWGTQANNGLTSLVDTSIAGTSTITMVAADYTLSTANGASDEARAAILNVTGTPGAARNIIVPAASKLYVVYNNTTGGFAQTVKTSAGTGISVPNGATAYLRCDGTNVVAAVDYFGSLTLGSLTLGSALPVASGGTGVTTSTGTGSVVLSTSPTLVTPILGTPTSVTLTNATGLPLTTGVTGTLPVGNGGTGAATFTANNVLLGNGTSAFQVVAPGANGNVLTSNGTTWISATPTAQVYPGAGMAVSTGSAWGTSKNTPAGDVVGTSDSQTLTNKTLTSYTETVFTITDGGTVNLNPNNGPIQLWTLGANRTPGQTSWSNGQSILLMVDDGTAFTITWSSLSVTWKTNGGVAPTLNTSGYTVIVLWKVGGVIYGARVGDA